MPRHRPRGRGRQGHAGAPSHQDPSSSDSNSEDVEQPPVAAAHPEPPGAAAYPDPPGAAAYPDPPGAGPLVDPAHAPLFYLQDDHRSKAIIAGNSLPALIARHHVVSLIWHPRYKPYLIKAGLYGVHQIGHVPADVRLITALVERWREETHTFHLPIGEATVTLEDVAVLFGLLIDGRPLLGRTDLDWSVVVQTLLGCSVNSRTFKDKYKTKMRLTWLKKKFHMLPDNAEEITVQYYARAYMLVLVGSVLFTDLSGDCVPVMYLPFFENFEEAGKYSWGSAVLAYLYRELCLSTSLQRRQIGGALILLQMWSWERFPFGRPLPRQQEPELGGDDIVSRPPYGYKWSGHHKFAEHVTCRLTGGYRDDIDRFTDDTKVNWTPYEQEKHLLSPVCTGNSDLWMTTAPLIHFWIVEMYNPERVMRQFSLYQSFPPFFRDTDRDLHKMKHGNHRGWLEQQAEYLGQWEERWDNIVMEERPYDPSTFEGYKRWLSSASILRLQTSQMRSADQPWIHPRLLHYQQIVPDMQSTAEKIWELTRGAAQLLRAWDEGGAKAFVHSVLSVGKSALEDLGEFTALDDTFHVLDEEHQAEYDMEDDVPEDLLVGSGDTLEGSHDHRSEMGQDELQNHLIPVPESNTTCMRPDEAGPSRPPPKRGRVYRGGLL